MTTGPTITDSNLADGRIDSESNTRDEPSVDEPVLATEVAACLPVFPILCKQLTETTGEVESSVVNVCDSFQGMVNQARELVTKIQAVTNNDVDASTGPGMVSLIQSAGETMENLLERIELSSQLSVKAIEQMNAVQEGMAKIEQRMSQVDELARNARLVALNGRIEAARAGVNGSAFAIVANETASLALNATEISDSIRVITAELANATEDVQSSVRMRAEDDQTRVAESRTDVDQILDLLAKKHKGVESTIEETSIASEKLANDISKAVMALQFQDAMSQRVGHVVKTLEMIDQELREKVTPLVGDACDDSKWMDELSSRYVMAAQREVHGIDTASPDLGDDIELF